MATATVKADAIARAIARAEQEGIVIVGHGTIKTSGQRIFGVRGRTDQYTVLVHRDRLECSCPAGQHARPCKHRAVVYQRLVAEHAAKQQQRETAAVYRSNAPVSMWRADH